MRQKLRDTLSATVSTLLEPDERSEATGRARPGHVSVKANLALATASAILSGGSSAMYATKKDIYVVLTDRRLIILEAHWLTFRPTAKVLGALPRPLLVSDVKRGFMTSFVVSATGDPNGLQLSFPRTERPDAEAMLTALGAPAA